MSKLDDAADVYNKIEIPEELDNIVQRTIAQHPKKEMRQEEKKTMDKDNRTEAAQNAPEHKIRSYRGIKFAAYAAAAAAVCFTVALNTNEAFATGAGSIPFIGGIARVLTVNSYEESENDKNVTVNVPAVKVSEEAMEGTGSAEAEPDQGGNGGAESTGLKVLAAQQFTGDINDEIQKIVDDYVADAKQRFDEYKAAFFATGGTEEEWAGRDMDIDVDYEVKYQKGAVISFVLTTTEAWASVYGEQYYYNLDLADNRRLTLEDILGGNYVEIANAVIIEGIHQRMAENEDYVYWGFKDDGIEDIEGFQTVTEDTSFYINADGNPVVCFPKYEICPGFMGVQEFEIPIEGQ